VSRIVLHIPHSSREIPDDIRPSLKLSDDALQHELNRMTDHMTVELFELESATRVIYPVSRLVVDPERFTDDSQEAMAAKGLGVVYTKREDGTPLRSELTAENRQGLIDRFYVPHHQALEKAVERALEEHGQCIIIDCHSFPLKPLSYEEPSGEERPDICFGTDDFHTSEQLLDAAQGAYAEAFEIWGVNDPFSGTIVPMHYWQKNRRVQSIMIEVRRDLYWDDQKGAPSKRWEATKKSLQAVLEAIEACELFKPFEEEESYCPFCGELSSYPSDPSCEHKLGHGNDYEGYLLRRNQGEWAFGSDMGSSLEMLVGSTQDHDGVCDALEQKFGANAICAYVIENQIRKEDCSIPWSLLGDVRVGEAHVTGGMGSSYVETWFSDDITRAAKMIAMLDEMWEWLKDSELLKS
jgi:N-formylglutamate deformylase